MKATLGKISSIMILLALFIFLTLITPSFASDFYTPSSKTSCFEGICTEILYADRMFYEENNTWKTINTTIKISNDTYWDYEMKENEFKVYFKDDIKSGKANRFYNENYWFEYDLSGGKMQWDIPKSISPIQSSIGTVSGNIIRYDGAFKDTKPTSKTDVEYEILSEMLKERFYLKSLPSGGSSGVKLQYIGEIAFSNNLEIWANGNIQPTKTFTTQGRIEFKNATNQTIFYLSKPIAYYFYTVTENETYFNDTTNQTETEYWNTTKINATDIEYDVKASGGKLQFALNIPYDFLSVATYPVYIDPTVYYNFTVVNNNKAYGTSHDLGTVVTALASDFIDEDVPTLAEVFGIPVSNFTAGGYSTLSTLNNGFANITSGHNNNEPFGVFNFSTKSSASVNWVNVTLAQKEIVGAGTTEHCYYGVANFTNGGWIQFGAYMDSTTVVTRTYNFTIATDIAKIINGNNNLAMLSWGTLSDSGDGCAVDWVSVIVNYNSTMTFSNPSTNVSSNVAPNTPVNFTMTATTNNDDISHYLFSSNFSDGTWRNSSWVAMSGTQTTGTTWNVTTSTSGGVYGWKFCANTSTNFVNCSDIQAFNFTTRTLLVNWTDYNAQSEINATTCTYESPCTYTQYSVFNASANVSCLTNPAGQSCGSITGGIMYNNTATTYDWISTTQDATPFYILGGAGEQKMTPTFAWNTTIDDEYSQDVTTRVSSSDNDYSITYYDNTLTQWGHTYVNFTTSETYENLTVEWHASQSLSGGIIRCWTGSDWVNIITLISGLGTSDINSTGPLSSCSNSNGNYSFKIYGTKIGQNIYIYVDYIFLNRSGGAQNPQSLGALNYGQSYLLNYTVNATDTPTKLFNMTFNFTSDNSAVSMNRTPDAFVRIGTAGPQTYYQSPTLSLSYSEQSSMLSSIYKTTTDSSSYLEVNRYFRGVDQLLTTSSAYADMISRFMLGMKSLLDYSTYSESLQKASQFLKSLTSFSTYSGALSKVQSLFKSLTSSVSYSESLLAFATRIRALTDFISYSEQASKFSMFFKSLTDLLSYLESIVIPSVSQTYLINQTSSTSYSELSTMVSSFFRSTTQSSTYSESISRLGAIYRYLADYSAYSESSARLSSFFKSLTSSSTYSELPIRLQSYFKTLSDYLTYSESYTRIASLFRSLTSYFTYSESTIRLQSLFRSVTDYKTYSNALSKIYTDISLLTSYFTYSDSTIRLQSLFRSLTSYFIYSDALSKIYTDIGLFTSYFTSSDSTIRLQSSFKSLSDYFTYIDSVSRLQSFFKSLTESIFYSDILTKTTTALQTYTQILSDYLTYNESTSRLHSLFKSLTDYSTYSESISRFSSLLKSLSNSLTYSELISKFGIFSKSLSFSITYQEIIAKLGIYQKNPTASITYSELLIKLGLFYQNKVDSITYYELLSKLGIFGKGLSDSTTYADIISKLGLLYKNPSDSITYAELLTKLGIFARYPTSYFTYSESYTRLQSLFKSLTDYSTYSDALSRIYTDIGLFTSYFTSSDSTIRLQSSFKSLSDYFTYIDSVSRLQSLFKSLTESITYSELTKITTAVQAYLQILSDYLTYSDSTIRLQSLFNSLTSYFTYSESYTRLQSLFKSLTSSTTYNELSQRITNFFIIRLEPTTYAELLTKLGIFARYPTSYFTYSESYTRLQSLFKSLTDYSTYNDLINKFPIRIASISDYLTYSESISRLSSLFKSLTDYITYFDSIFSFNSFLKSITDFTIYNEQLERFPITIKSITDFIIYSEGYSRTIEFIRLITSYFNYSENAYIIETIYKISFQTYYQILSDFLSFSETIYKTSFKVYDQILSDFLSFSEMVNRIGEFRIKISEPLSILEISARLQSFIRTVSDFFGLGDTTYWLRQLLCSSISSESVCASNGCYWCSGACQANTCPPPITPPSGGGIWIPPPITNVTPEVKTVLDTSVHVETPEVNPGDKIYAIITLMKVKGPQEIINVNLSYWIKDNSGNILGMKQTVVGVETIRSDIYYLAVPISAPSGTYTFEALAQYNNATDYSFDNFQVTTIIAKPSIVIKRVDVPFILVNENTTIKVVLENLESRKINLNATLLLPYGFNPKNITKSLSIELFSEDVIEFSFISQVFGSFSGFIKVEYEDKKIIKDFDIEVYTPGTFIIYLINNYWWIISLIVIALLAFFIYKTKDRFKKKEKVKYVFERKELLPKI